MSRPLSRFHREYTKVRVVGKGSFGEAVLCTRNGSGEQVVVKRIKVKMDRNEEKQALNEVRILSGLNHTNIVRYIDSWIEDGILHIVMEFADGGDLYSKLRTYAASGYALREELIAEWFLQMCCALDYMHSQKILHRDLKTQNIFITNRDVTIKLGDFGIARTLENTAELARTVVGTPYYLSPEIVTKQPYNQKSDVWALGVVLYELLTGKHPFTAGGLPELMQKITLGVYIPVERAAPTRKYSKVLLDLLASMLSLNPADRPTTSDILQMQYFQDKLGQRAAEYRSRVGAAAGVKSPLISAQRPSALAAPSPSVRPLGERKPSQVSPVLQKAGNNSPGSAQPRARGESPPANGRRVGVDGLPVIDLDEQAQRGYANRQRIIENAHDSGEVRAILYERDANADVRNAALLQGRRASRDAAAAAPRATPTQEEEAARRNAELISRIQRQRNPPSPPALPRSSARSSTPPPLERPLPYVAPRHPAPPVSAVRSVTPPPAPQRVLEPLDAQSGQPLEFEFKPRSPRAASPPSPLQRRPSPVAPPPAHPVPRFRQESPPPVNAGVRAKGRDSPPVGVGASSPSPSGVGASSPSPRLAFADSKLPAVSPVSEQYRAAVARKEERRSEASPSGLGICANLRSKARVPQVGPKSPPTSREAPRPPRRQYSPITRFLKIQDLAVSSSIMNAGRESPHGARGNNQGGYAHSGDTSGTDDTTFGPKYDGTNAAMELNTSINVGKGPSDLMMSFEGSPGLQEVKGELIRTGCFDKLQFVPSQSEYLDDAENFEAVAPDEDAVLQLLQTFHDTFTITAERTPEDDEESFGSDAHDDLTMTLVGLDAPHEDENEFSEETSHGCIVDMVPDPDGSYSSRCESLRKLLEDELGLETFLQGYRLMSAEAEGQISSVVATHKVKALLGFPKIQFAHLIRLLLRCEQSCFSPEAQC